MAFTIFSSTHNGIPLINLKDEHSRVTVSLVPQHGAMLYSFSVEHKGVLHNVIENYDNLEELEKELPMNFKNIKMSPFACRIKEGKYMYEGEEFEFTEKFLDGSAIHGLLYNKPFLVIDEFKDEIQASVLLKYNFTEEEEEGYPFNYRCEIRYTLLPDRLLEIQTKIINLDDLPIPMMDGWHPYFKLGSTINNCLLYFNASTKVEFDEYLVPSGHLADYSEFNEEKLIGHTELDNCFLLNEDNGYASCTLRDPGSGLELSIFPDESYPYLQIYTPANRNSIAIENLSAAPDAFNNKMGLLMMSPRQTHTFTVHYQLTCE